ncbi:MAG: two-component regulator propeller domain-containing protein [Aestuariibaculum sp.]
MKWYYYFFQIIFLFTITTIIAQNKEPYMFHTFSPDGGFSYEGVISIKQDTSGFIWILMENNLFRFDGYNYKRYSSSFIKPDDKYEKDFRSITVNKQGQIFVSLSDGLYAYNKTTDTFDHLLTGRTSLLKTDKDNGLWMNHLGNFGKYNDATGTFTKLIYNEKPLSYVHAAIAQENGFFLLAWGKRIFKYNNKTKKVSPFYSFKGNSHIKHFCKINNALWLLLNNGQLYKLDIPTGNIIDQVNILPPNNKIYLRELHVDKNNNIWISSQNGLFILDTKTMDLQHYVHDKLNPFSIPNNSVWSIEEDSQRNIWIGTYSGGVSYVNLDKKTHFKSFVPIRDALNHNLISGFAENNGSLWVATEGGGLNKINLKTNEYSYYKNDTGKNSISSNNIKSIIADHNNNLWFATFRGGLGHYNSKQDSFSHLTHVSDNKNTPISNNLRKLIPNSDSGLWIVYQLNKLRISYYSYKNKTFTHYDIDKADSDHYIFDMCEGHNGLMWIVTHNKLYALNTKDGSAEKIELPDTSLLYGQTLCVDAKDNLWIGTVEKGLIRYNIETKTFTSFNDILKFNVSTIYSICTDNENNIWIGTDNGLFKHNTTFNTLYRFDKKDGVQGQVFFPLATYKNKAGILYFGGTNGFTVINPYNIVRNKKKPKATISNFFINNTIAKPFANQSSTLNTASFPETITLDYKESNFSFTISSNNYLIPEKNRFKYRLKGYNSQWMEVDALNRNVHYSKIPPGRYTFEVLTANNDGIWGKPLQININRLPAPWFSWWAYTLYAILLGWIAFAFFRYQKKQKALKMQLYIDKLNWEKKEELHQAQLKLFTNISHDFRTPLSLISALVDRLRKEGLKEYYYRILNGNTKRLLGLVNELMDFRTVENGKMPLQLTKTNINRLVRTLAFDFNDYANHHNISFTVITDPELKSKLYVDKHILEKVTVNLLNNAFKYTDDGGNISVSVYANVKNFHSNYTNKITIGDINLDIGYFAIVIKDSGKGMPAHALENIFDRFYKTSTENRNPLLGTGIGLALVKSLILLHKGIITVYSEPKKGTEFVVCFPTETSTYEAKHFLNKKAKNNTPAYKNIVPVAPLEITAPLPKENNYTKDKRNIIVAEDNIDLREMIVDYLSSNFNILEAENGLEVLRILEKKRIDLIISDIMMPKMDGIALCREVKENIDFSHIPFVLLTAKVGLDSKLEGAQSGADLYFEKPIDFELLVLSINNIFKQQQQIRQYYSKNFFAKSHELTTNQREREFMQKFITVLDKNLDKPEMDINQIASELFMSRSKLYNKIKGITGQSIIKFITNYRLRKAAHLIIEKDISMREVMTFVGLESQSYFSRMFKKEFGSTPTNFALQHKKGKTEG